MRILFVAAALWVAAATASAHEGHSEPTPLWQAASAWPDRIIATLTEDPATSFAVTWRTDGSVGRTLAEIAPATADARFDLAARTLPAETERLDLAEFVTPDGVRRELDNAGLGIVHQHSVVFDGLEPNTLYAYRVQGARGQWSEWHQIRTAPRSGPFSFVYMGDAQQGVRTHWARVVRMSQRVAPDARFFLHAGDLVQQGPSDWDWAGWFNAGGFLFAQTPSVPVLGNHDHMRVYDPDSLALTGVQGARGARVPSSFWRAQFTLPEERDLPAEMQEYVYDIRYNDDLHVFVMDSTPSNFNRNGGYRIQSRWLSEHLRASSARWKVVSMHHPYFYPLTLGGREDAAEEMRAAFEPVIAAGDVDLVLVGHIHFYSRSSTPDNAHIPGDVGARAISGDPRDVGTMFVVSAAAASQDDIPGVDPAFVADQVGDGSPDAFSGSIDRVAENTPMFQVIDVDGPRLGFRAFMATGEIYDQFSLEQVDEGRRTVLTDGPAAFGDTRLFNHNSGPLRGWHDLQ